MRRTRAASLVAVTAVATLLLAACGGGGGNAGGEGGGGAADQTSQGGILAECGDNPLDCNSVPADQLQQGGQITVALEKNIDNWFLISSEGNTSPQSNAIHPMLPYTYSTLPDLSLALNEDVFVSGEQTNTNPQTIEFKIKPEAVWNDGTPVSAQDFIYNWKYQDGKTCPSCRPATTAGYDQIASIVGSDGDKTVTVTFAQPYTDWKNLWSAGSPMYPAHIAAQQGDINTEAGLVAAEAYFGTTTPTYSAGPYQVENWQPETALTTVPNPQWYGADKPKLDRIVYRIITDATQEPIALQNDEVQVIFPQPQVDLVQQVAQIPGVSQQQSLGLSWEHIDFNADNPALTTPLRQALAAATPVQEMIDKTVGQFNDEVTPLKSSVLLPGLDGYQDNVGDTGLGSGDIEKAKKILTDAGYTGVGTALVDPNGQPVPTMRMRYTVGNAIRQTQSEIFVAAAKQLGVTFEIQTTDDLGGTLDAYDYDAIVFAYISSPFPFGNAQQEYTSTSASNYVRFKDPEADRLLAEAASSTDQADALTKLNEVDKKILAAAATIPLYQKPTYLAIKDNIANARDNASLDSPTYNIAQWGLRNG
ncbi:ABC transporter family substrate-binding protein [Pseudonocardia lacus]|uniref:ABC transporter family substrate-binding protein n=1 Tax=Pseudonocardia lacus TaxID=2835865 RepID=UPI001BDDB850|nr:ABC transporter family substrate-binding protein [Pseudonocardia lacus]